MTEKLEYIPPPNKNVLIKKPLIAYLDNLKELEVSPKLKNNIHVKPKDEEHIKLDIYKPRITEEEDVKLNNKLQVKKFKNVKAEGVKEFLLLFGIKDRPIKKTDNINFYRFNLKNQNPTTLMITNWRKELGEKPTPLGLRLSNTEDNVKFEGNYSKSDFMKAYKEKIVKKDYKDHKDDIDKDYKSKEEALLSNPNIKDKGKKLEALRANKEKIKKNIVEIKPIVKTEMDKKDEDHKPSSSKQKGKEMSINTDIMESKTDEKSNEETTIKEMEEKKQKELKKLEEEHKKQLQEIMDKFKEEAKETMKYLEDRGISTYPIKEIVKEIDKKSEDKSINTQEFNKYLTEKSEEVKKIKKEGITKFVKKLEEEEYKREIIKFNRRLRQKEDKGTNTDDLKETLKEMVKISEDKGLDTSDLEKTIKEIEKEADKIEQKEKSKKEKAELRKSLTKKVKDKMDEILEDVNEQKEKGEKLVDRQETGVEANMIKIFNDNFLVKGDVKREAVLKNMEDLTGKIDHIINTLKGHGIDKRKVLNKESKDFFNENVIPVLQKDFNIDYEQLLSLFNKNSKQNLQYSNLNLLKKTIKEFLKDKEHLEK